MRLWVGVTDNDWYSYLSQGGYDEVNFWQPSATPPFKNAPVGMPFLFKLKSPHNAIAGGGFFVTYSTLPISLAWDVFREKNGASSLEGFRALLDPLMSKGNRTREIGCTVLSDPQKMMLATPLPNLGDRIAVRSSTMSDEVMWSLHLTRQEIQV